MGLSCSPFPPPLSKLVRDLRVSALGGQVIALTCGMDKRLTLTSLNNGTALHSFLLPVPVWSCEWSKEECNSFFCGLQNGCVVAFDMVRVFFALPFASQPHSHLHSHQRKLDAPVSILAGPPGPPVHTLLYHEPMRMLIAASASQVRCFEQPSSLMPTGDRVVVQSLADID